MDINEKLDRIYSEIQSQQQLLNEYREMQKAESEKLNILITSVTSLTKDIENLRSITESHEKKLQIYNDILHQLDNRITKAETSALEAKKIQDVDYKKYTLWLAGITTLFTAVNIVLLLIRVIFLR